MIIGFDGKRAVFNNTGLGNYARLLVEVLAKEYPDNNYRLYTPGLRSNSRLKRLLKLPNVDLVTQRSVFWRSFGSLWRSHGVTSDLAEDGVTLFHGLSGDIPDNLRGAHIPSVVTIHDAVFRRFPEDFSYLDRTVYDRACRYAAQHADRIIAISECTARDIVNYYGVSRERIDVIYQGCHEQFHTRPSDEVIASTKVKYGLKRPYIISVGTIEPRKNQMMAVRGLAGLSDEVDLVLVGRRTPYVKLIDRIAGQYSLTSRVKILDRADFADLPALYAGAYMSSYTSRYEGFGIPVIESLSVGTPVIIASGSSLEEAAGPSQQVVHPDDVEGWIAAIRDITDHPGSRAKLAAQGREYVARFSDAAMARQTMATYQRAIAEARF